MPNESSASDAKLADAANSYAARVELFGLYLDATSGFMHNRDLIVKIQHTSGPALGMTIEQFDVLPFAIGGGDPNDPEAVVDHYTTQGKYKERNGRNGTNSFRLAQLLLVLVYEYWDSEHRHAIAAALGLSDTKELKVPVLGDLRLLRHDVIHKRAIVSIETVSKLEVLTKFEVGNAIRLEENDVREIVRGVKAAIDQIVIEKTGDDPGYRNFWRIN
jgi:hypothetical protein